MRRRKRGIANLRASLRREFVNRPGRRPGAICQEVEANSMRLRREAREAERFWWRSRRRPTGDLQEGLG